MEIFGEVGEWVAKSGLFGGMGVCGEEDLGGFTYEVTAGEGVTTNVGGEGSWGGYFCC